MPYSAGENIDYVNDLIERIDPKTAIDIGPGAGQYGKLLKNSGKSISTTGVEIFEPYVGQFDLRSIYDTVVVSDAREYDNYSADLVIAADVLEHMTEDDMVELVQRIRSQAKWLLISVPIVHYPQGHSHGNAHEEHVQEDLNTEKIISLLGNPSEFNEYDVTGTYLYQGV